MRSGSPVPRQWWTPTRRTSPAWPSTWTRARRATCWSWAGRRHPLPPWGGLAATRTAARGAWGWSTPAGIRGLAEVSALRLAVWARGATPRSGKGRLAVTNVGAPVTVGGAVVNDRDLVIADSTGICVVPCAQRSPVLAYAAQLQDRDEAFRQALSTRAGFSSARREAGTM
ncbi:hypothetical protein [Amycolatopsis palatopharyngis]|uniref:RraA family protein n=1 Tax=Amycolatopsis palatopharyngis TaxID=187982 RepID=UPI000E27BF99|nr:hypothetical protein [Amycolatopsis palatopharyngis]